MSLSKRVFSRKLEDVNDKCEEFRPINSLKLCEKILEKTVKKYNSNNTRRIIIFYLNISLGLEKDIHAKQW